MPGQPVIESSSARWRQLGRYLWAGTGCLGPIGTVEQGRRFNAVSTSGDVVGRCRSLRDAEALLEQGAEAAR